MKILNIINLNNLYEEKLFHFQTIFLITEAEQQHKAKATCERIVGKFFIITYTNE